MELLFATNNKHKIDEIRAILGPDYTVRSMAEIGFTESVEEDATTFEGNALLKAQAIYSRFHIPCFSDDSGLEVTALNNEPGVYSARYAGEQGNHKKNREKLLAELLNKDSRKAQFRTVICYIDPNGNDHYFEGIIHGEIATAERGSNGFGYDSLFIPQGHTRTFAEMSEDEKNSISHRALAVRKFSAFLREQ